MAGLGWSSSSSGTLPGPSLWAEIKVPGGVTGAGDGSLSLSRDLSLFELLSLSLPLEASLEIYEEFI